MSDNSEEKPFKSLKLTTLKAAKSPAPGESSVPDRPVPGAGVPAGGASSAVPSPESASESPVAATPPPALSPSAAASGPVLKPFKVLPVTSKPTESTPAAEDSKAFKSLDIKVVRAATAGTVADVMATPAVVTATPEIPVAAEGGAPPPLPAIEAVESVAAEAPVPGPVSSVGVKLKAAGQAAAVEPAVADRPKAAVAKPSMKPLLFIGGGLLALMGAAAAIVFLMRGGDSAKPMAALKPPVSAAPEAPKPVVPIEPAQPGPPVDSSGATMDSPVSPPAEVFVARQRNQEVESWLAGAKVTAISLQRLTMNDHLYALNDIVREEGRLRWVGRDSRTAGLLFIDEAGVVYVKSTRAN